MIRADVGTPINPGCRPGEANADVVSRLHQHAAREMGRLAGMHPTLYRRETLKPRF